MISSDQDANFKRENLLGVKNKRKKSQKILPQKKKKKKSLIKVITKANDIEKD